MLSKYTDYRRLDCTSLRTHQNITILMKYNTIKNAALALSIFAGAVQLSADSFSLADGSRIDGEIIKAQGSAITISDASGKRQGYELSRFDSSTQSRSNLGKPQIQKSQTSIQIGTNSPSFYPITCHNCPANFAIRNLAAKLKWSLF